MQSMLPLFLASLLVFYVCYSKIWSLVSVHLFVSLTDYLSLLSVSLSLYTLLFVCILDCLNLCLCLLVFLCACLIMCDCKLESCRGVCGVVVKALGWEPSGPGFKFRLTVHRKMVTCHPAV